MAGAPRGAQSSPRTNRLVELLTLLRRHFRLLVGGLNCYPHSAAMTKEPIETIRASTAQELILKLSPGQEMWCETGGQTCWVFRGVADSGWGLRPAAMRRDAFMHWGIGVATAHRAVGATEQRRQEQQTVMAFAGECIDCALALPEDSQWFRDATLQEAAFSNNQIAAATTLGANFPFPLYRSLYALAQHHEVPTRLLDWSKNPLTAAYFACYEVAKWRKQNPAKRCPSWQTDELCVWALRSYLIRNELADSEPTVDLVDAPYATNPNLRAQRGLFTLVKYNTDAGKDVEELPDLDALVLKHQTERYAGHDTNGNWPLLRKLVLPHAEAGMLLRRLHDANVNSGTIYPNYDGVVRSRSDRQYWA